MPPQSMTGSAVGCPGVREVVPLRRSPKVPTSLIVALFWSAVPAEDAWRGGTGGGAGTGGGGAAGGGAGTGGGGAAVGGGGIASGLAPLVLARSIPSQARLASGRV